MRIFLWSVFMLCVHVSHSMQKNPETNNVLNGVQRSVSSKTNDKGWLVIIDTLSENNISISRLITGPEVGHTGVCTFPNGSSLELTSDEAACLYDNLFDRYSGTRK